MCCVPRKLYCHLFRSQFYAGGYLMRLLLGFNGSVPDHSDVDEEEIVPRPSTAIPFAVPGSVWR
jgi:hypothetical protein